VPFIAVVVESPVRQIRSPDAAAADDGWINGNIVMGTAGNTGTQRSKNGVKLDAVICC
jgi:hypothetical protein